MSGRAKVSGKILIDPMDFTDAAWMEFACAAWNLVGGIGKTSDIRRNAVPFFASVRRVRDAEAECRSKSVQVLQGHYGTKKSMADEDDSPEDWAEDLEAAAEVLGGYLEAKAHA